MAKKTETIENEAIEYETPTSSNFNYGYDDLLVMEDVANRNLYLTDDIDEDIFKNINYFIIKCNEEDKGIAINQRRPIYLWINSCGGNVWDGLSCIETIRVSKTPVYAITTGYALSTAFHIFVNCHKRFATKNAIFLNHEGKEWFAGHPSKNRDLMGFEDKLNERLNELLIKKTKITKKELTAKERVEWYLFADEAKLKGVVDVVINNFDDIT